MKGATMDRFMGLMWLESTAPDTEEVTSSNLVTPTNFSQVAPDVPDVACFCMSHVDDLRRYGHLEPSTHRAYRYLMAHVRRFFGDVAVGDLKPSDLAAFVRNLDERGLSQGTQRKTYNMLVMCLRHAHAIGMLSWEPTKAVRAPRNACPPPNPLTAESLAVLRERLAVLEPTPCVIAANMALLTGMRRGEVCGLQWRDVDLGEMPTAHVCRSIGIGDGGTYVKATKTGAERDVPLVPSLARMLSARRREMMAGCSDLGLEMRPTHYVIGKPSGEYLSPYRVTRWWGEHAREWGLVGTRGRVPTFHDLRHTFATIAVRSVDVKTAQSIMGHASAEMTMRYADTELGQVRGAIGAISQGFGA